MVSLRTSSLGANRVEQNRKLREVRRESWIHGFGEMVWVDPVQQAAAEILYEQIVKKNTEPVEIRFPQLLIAGLLGSCEVHEFRDEGSIDVSRVSDQSDAVGAN